MNENSLIYMVPLYLSKFGLPLLYSTRKSFSHLLYSGVKENIFCPTREFCTRNLSVELLHKLTLASPRVAAGTEQLHSKHTAFLEYHTPFSFDKSGGGTNECVDVRLRDHVLLIAGRFEICPQGFEVSSGFGEFVSNDRVIHDVLSKRLTPRAVLKCRRERHSSLASRAGGHGQPLVVEVVDNVIQCEAFLADQILHRNLDVSKLEMGIAGCNLSCTVNPLRAHSRVILQGYHDHGETRRT